MGQAGTVVVVVVGSSTGSVVGAAGGIHHIDLFVAADKGVEIGSAVG